MRQYPLDLQEMEAEWGEDEYQAIFRARGRPGEEYRRDECMKAVKKAFRQNMGLSDTEEDDEEEERDENKEDHEWL
jgi:hypothetical protein